MYAHCLYFSLLNFVVHKFNHLASNDWRTPYSPIRSIYCLAKGTNCIGNKTAVAWSWPLTMAWCLVPTQAVMYDIPVLHGTRLCAVAVSLLNVIYTRLWSWLGVILFNCAQRAFCEQKRCWWMRCPQGGFGQVLAQVFRQRGTTSFRDPRGVRIYLRNSLLVFTGSCSLSWPNGAARRAVGQSACFRWTDKNPCWHSETSEFSTATTRSETVFINLSIYRMVQIWPGLICV